MPFVCECLIIDLSDFTFYLIDTKLLEKKKQHAIRKKNPKTSSNKTSPYQEEGAQIHEEES